MRLSRASYYALQAVAHMASQKENKAMTSQSIAKTLGISDRFLLKVLQPLVQVNVLVSLKGPHGGYRLARKPGEISMLEIVEAADHGKITGFVPPLEKDWNMDENLHKRLETVCTQTAENERELLEKVSLADLLSSKKLQLG